MTFIGKGGYWEGRVEGKEGWFPRLAIKELGDEEFDYSTLTKGASKAAGKLAGSSEAPREVDIGSALPKPEEPKPS